MDLDHIRIMEPDHSQEEAEMSFDLFMDEHKVFDADEYTMTRLGGVYGKYYVSDDEYDKFINLYKRVIPYREEYITEKQKDLGPILIDLDFRQEKRYRDRKYLDSHIEQVAKITIDIIIEYLKISKSDIEALVFEKETPTYDAKKGNYKDGFHIIIPVCVDVKMRYYIYQEMKDKIKNEGILDDLPYVNEFDDVVDISVVKRNGWLLYGSKKNGGSVYRLSHIYDSYMNEKRLDTYDDAELVALLAIRRFGEEDELKYKTQYDNDEFMKQVFDLYEELTGANKRNKNKLDKPNTGNKDNPGNNKMDALMKKLKPYNRDSLNDIEMAKKLVNILSAKRGESYFSWLYVGWTLYNIDDSLLETYDAWSKKYSKSYEPGCCAKVWKNAEKYMDYTIASLYWWAKQDNPVAYLEVIRSNINKMIEEAENGTHDDIAKVVYEMYKHVFKCASIKKNIWYEFQGNKWVLIDNAYTLSNLLSDEMTKEFSFLASSYFHQVGNSMGIEKDTLMGKAKNITKIIDKLKNTDFKKSVISACAHRFYRKGFEELLDNNKDLLGFENGVYDLKASCFRPGIPDDYLTMSVGYDYVDFDDDDPMIHSIMHYFETVLMDDKMRKYVLSLIASYLDGHNRNQKFILWTGSGCHAPGSKILMHSGKRINVEDIQLNDLIMGDDGKPRKVKTLFRGVSDMYNVKLDNGDSFTVNKSHRLALRNHLNKNIYKGTNIYDEDAYIVEWYEYIEDIPIIKTMTFKSEEEAIKCLEEQKKDNEKYISYGEVVPISVSDYLNLDKSIRDNFKMYQAKINISTPNKIHAHQTGLDFIKNRTPETLCRGSYEQRLAYVNGLLDKFGAYDMENNRYILPSVVLEDSNTAFIIRSLGYRIDMIDNMCIISGYNLNKLTVMDWKQEYGNTMPTNMTNNHIVCAIIDPDVMAEYMFDYSIVSLDLVARDKDTDPNTPSYYGFELDGNKRYVMDNCMVTYNSNGKSTTVDLIQHSMGEYFGVLPTTVLTMKRKSSSGASPELANKRGKRFLVIQEPEHDDTVYVGQMKNLTGSDWIEARALYGDPFMYKPQFKLVLICNKLPFIPANDDGTWRRLRVTPWESEFVDKPVKPNQFKKDSELLEKLKEWRQGFIWILLRKYYRDYREKGIEEPAKVSQYTGNFRKDSDLYYEFIKDNMKITGEKRDKESVQVAYEGFKGWYKSSYSNNIPGRKEFTAYLSSVDKIKIINGFIIGATLNFNGMEDDESESTDSTPGTTILVPNIKEKIIKEETEADIQDEEEEEEEEADDVEEDEE
jgi:P4 family phage/plasmid primase-like protien